MKDSGGYFNALEALDTINQQNEFLVADMKWIDGSDGNDFIVGSNNFNEMRLGSGDDVFEGSEGNSNIGMNKNSLKACNQNVDVKCKCICSKKI